MACPAHSAFLRALLCSFGLLLSFATLPCWAQVAPHGYDFLTVTTLEGNTKLTTKLLYSPAFQGTQEIQLEDLNASAFGRSGNPQIIQRNTVLVNQKLSELSSAGWELVSVTAVNDGLIPGVKTCYLFRKARP